MTNNQKFLLWVTEFPEGVQVSRFIRQREVEDSFICTDPQISILEKKMFYTSKDIEELYKQYKQKK